MGIFAAVHAASDSGIVKRKESAVLNSLYEVKELYSIGDANETENIDPTATYETPIINTTSNRSWLAVAVNSDISMYNLLVDCVYEASYDVGDSTICATSWLGDSHILAVFTSHRHLVLISPKLGLLLDSKLHQHEQTQSLSARISTTEIGDQCIVCIVDNNGITDTIMFSYWSSFMNCNDTDHSRDNLQKVIKSATVNCCQAKHVVADILASKALCSIVSLSKESPTLRLSSFGSSSYNFHISTDFWSSTSDIVPKLAGHFVRIREACNGRYLVGVTSMGEMVIHDLWTLYHITNEKPIDLKIEKNAEVLDFFFIEAPRDEFVYKNIALVIRNESTLYLQVTSIADAEVSYTLKLEKGAEIMVADADATQRVLLLVEPIENSNMLSLKEIAEAEPEQKLTRLIEQNRLDDAEKFAIEFGLDCQRVYVSRMDNLFEEACGDSNPEVFKRFVNSMDKVGETCYSGAATFTDYGRIQTLLQYAEKRSISDKECAKRLENLAYVFATYRMVVSPENADFSNWGLFVEGTNWRGKWPEIFNLYLENSQISEARVIFHRHKYVLESILLEGQGPQLFETMKDVLHRNIDYCSDVMNFVEFDLIPHLIREADERCTLLSSFVDFLIHVARRLEKFDPSHFPENSLHITSMLERIFTRLTDTSITPVKQALLALIGRDYYSPESRSQELVTYSENLRAIQRLTDVYQCSLSYDTYISLDPERICYRILQAAVDNPNQVSVRMSRYARPYMNEHRLDPDRTIFHYVEDVSKNALFAVTPANPWHEQCLLISQTIDNYSLRCEAILIIARKMQPPWPKKLADAIQVILKSKNTDEELAKQLQMVCHRAELGQILQSNNVSFHLLDTILANERQFSKFLMYLVQQEAPLDELIKNAKKAVDLYKSISSATTYIVNHTFVYISIAVHLLRSSGVKDMICYLNSLESTEDNIQAEVISTLVDKLVLEINTSVEFSDENVISQRLNILFALEGLIQHFRSSDPEFITIYNDVITVRKLQERHKKWVTTTDLHDDEWKSDEFTKMLNQDLSLSDLYAFSDAIRMKPDDARMIALRCVSERSDLKAIAEVLKESVLSIVHPCEKLVEMYLQCCECIFKHLPEALKHDEVHADDEILDAILDIIWMLKPILSELAAVAIDKEAILEKALRMEHFVRLFLLTVESFVAEDAQVNSDNDSNKHERCNKEDRICGMSRRLGTYHIGYDGAILNQKEVMFALCAVAPSIILESNISSQKDSLANEMYNLWDNLCANLENQDALVYLFRVFSCYLPCFHGTPNFIHDSLKHNARNVLEKTIQSHPCDLWTACGVLMSLPPKMAHDLAIGMKQWVQTRKSPQTMINYLRIVQFVVVVLKEDKYFTLLTNSFIQFLWGKRLAKVGSGVNAAKPVYQALEDFAKRKMDPLMVSEFLSQFYSEQVDDQLLNYVMCLVHKASYCELENEMSAFLQTADLALKQCNSPRDFIYWRCRQALYTLCPYNYEPILFLVRLMAECIYKGGVQSRSDTDDKEPAKFAQGSLRIMEFLVYTKRGGAITKAEINWYMQFQKVYQMDLKENSNRNVTRKDQESFGSRVLAWYEYGSSHMTSTMERCDNELQYERADLLPSTLPQRAQKILPMHLFLIHLETDIESWLKPVVEAEVNLVTVEVWRNVQKVVPWLATLPRQMFLLHAVMKKTNECISKELPLEESDRRLIAELFTKHSSPADVASCITHSAKTLNLSMAKIQLLSIGVEVANMWLNDPNIPVKHKVEIEDYKTRYEGLVENYRTELILKREGLYDGKSSDLVESPIELINHIYSDCVNWNSIGDIQHKAEVINKLASINKLNLSEIQEKLVHRWLNEGEAVSDAFAVNLDDTMGSISMPTTITEMSDDADLAKLPFFDSSITKITHLLKQLDYRALYPKIYHHINDFASVGYKTAIRATCVLLRILTDADLVHFNNDSKNICNNIEMILVSRLLEAARVDMNYKSYQNTSNKLAVARGFLAPNKRHTPELCSLVASIVIDHFLDEKVLVETLLNKLFQAKKKDMYAVLLMHCRDTPALHSIKNLGILWPRVIDLPSLHEMPLEALHYWIYFLLSCPVEMKGFDPIRLIGQKLPIAAKILAISTGFTKSVADQNIRPDSSLQSKDLHFLWSTSTGSGQLREEEMEC